MKLLKSEGAVAEVVGNIIIMAITIIGIGMITLVGVPTIQKMEDMATVRNAEQTYTFLDSRASGTIIGDSPFQTIGLDMGGGTIRSEPNGSGIDNKSYITVMSSNNTINITIPMGAVIYQLGERTIAYEGGGVFSKYPSGASVMLSPPEIHFNGETLTLPVMTVNSATSIGGDGNAQISFKKVSTQVLFPNASIPNRTNPVLAEKEEKLYVNISSEYYEGWADYAKTLAYTSVSKDPGSKTTSLELEVVPPMGKFPLSNNIKISHLNTSNPTPLNNFSFYLVDASNKNNVANLEYEIEARNGTKEFNIEFEMDGSDFMIKIDYETPAGDEEWEGILLNGPPSTWTNSVEIDLMNKDLNLTFDEDSIMCTSWDPPITCTEGYTNMSVYDLMQHYSVLMGPDITFKADDDGDDTKQVDFQESVYTLYYDAGSGTFIIYMHITQNNMDVTLN